VTKQPYAAVVLPFDGLHPHNPCNCVDYYSFTDPETMEGRVGLVVWPTTDTLPTKWSLVNHRSGVGQGKNSNERLAS